MGHRGCDVQSSVTPWLFLGQDTGRALTSDLIEASSFHEFFDRKVQAVRDATAVADEPVYRTLVADGELSAFDVTDIADVTTAIRRLPDKQCATDLLPTWLFKMCAEELAPFLCRIFNKSYTDGMFPTTYKAAYVTPLLKKPNSDPVDVCSYRPISNLSVVSKLLERLTARRLTAYLTSKGLLPSLQSAYRANHSTETAVLKVLGDILLALDRGDFAALALLDLSAAFDTVDHVTLLRRLDATYGIRGRALGWFSSYLSGRTQFVRSGSSSSPPSLLLYGVPQGSVLGPILFLLYTADIIGLIDKHGLRAHLYADDTQAYGFCRPMETTQLEGRLADCVEEVATWMRANRLQLNADKTDVLWCSSRKRTRQLPSQSFQFGSSSVTPSPVVRSLGVWIDSGVTMSTHISKVAAGCFAVLRQLRGVRRSLPRDAFKALVVALVLSRLDYCNAVLVGLPSTQLDRLQAVMNTAARIIFSARRSDHITPLLQELHWLKIRDRIDFKLAVLVYRCLHGIGPEYLACDIRRVADVDSRRRLRSSGTAALVVPATRHPTLGDRAFPVAAARMWNSLPNSVTSASSLSGFRRSLKHFLFTRSYTTV